MGDHDAAPPKLPIHGERNILITSALPYCNNVPHLGNIIGCVLSADVYARYCRSRGYNVLYICGTDEYGTATETKAMEENSTPQQICNKYHAIHKQVYEWFGITFDKFGRTSTPEHTQICQSIFRNLLNKNQLTDSTIQQPFCPNCNRFLADRLLEGTCPREACKYEHARGDQCEKCGNVLNPTELINSKCRMCKTVPIIRGTRHLFLNLPALQDDVKDYVKNTSGSNLGNWSKNSVNITNAWFKEGLRERCITRDLKWGVPVPLEGFEDKVFYVWFDAPIGYISITASYTNDWEQWWKNPDNVELYQFMGKDNVSFHTIVFPSTLIGTGENWTKAKTISATEYLNYEGGKFSKSKGVGVFGNDVKDTGIPVEVWRYYLLTNRPEVSDTLFTWDDLKSKLNADLVKNLGNFINRVLKFIADQGYGSIVPDASDAESHLLTRRLADEVSKNVEEYIDALEKVELKEGLNLAMEISHKGNKYLTENNLCSKIYKQDQSTCSVVVKTAVGLVKILACLLEPFMPSITLEIFKQLNLPREEEILLLRGKKEEVVDRVKRPWELVCAGHQIGQPKPLFVTKMSADDLREKYAGSQNERVSKTKAKAVKKPLRNP